MTSRINTRALWGLAAGVLFGAAVSIGQTFEVVHSFTGTEGSDAQSGVTQMSNGDFFGTTVGDSGTVYAFDTQGHFNTVFSFGPADGTQPHATLIQGEQGLLFGATLNGALGWGSIYSWNSSGGLKIRAKLYPSTEGANGEGGSDHAPLLAVGSPLSSLVKYYGVTMYGGSNGFGTIYTLDADNDEYVTLRHFSGFDGKYPSEALIEVNGVLYGTTPFGGNTDQGTIYAFDPEHPEFNFRVLHSFAGADGAVPQAALLAVGGRLYGTTNLGGKYGMGTLFTIDPSGAGFSVLHSFQGLEGANPHATLMQARDGYLYGTTTAGGAGDTYSFFGSIFRLKVGDVSTSGFSILHRFSEADGISTQARLIEASDGALYGATQSGGSAGQGVVFRLVFVPVSMAPSSGPAAGGTAIAISGGNFQPRAGLTFAGVDAENVVVASDSSMTAKTPVLAPGTLNDVLVDNPDHTRGGLLKGYFADFLDVPQGDPFHGYVEKIFRNRITAGVGSGNFGRNVSTTRAQMAVFLLKAKHGPFYLPPVATEKPFEDVELGSFAADWIAELKAEGITGGCDGGTNYCPNAPMTREAMAVMLLKAKGVPTPTQCEMIFGDVSCTSPFAPWIEELYKEGITGGCYDEGGIFFFCPGLPSTRGQTAVFLTKAFVLP